MVQALRNLIEDECYDETYVAKALSDFECAYSNDDAEDVVYFLLKKAIPYEHDGYTRTYLIINDVKWEQGEIQIDGYFSIAIKNIYFKHTDPKILDAIFGEKSKNNYPAYLIGQLARGKYSPKGSGACYLQLALNYIANASEIVGGRLVYLDCSKDRQAYYEDKGFAFLQNKHNSNLIQMYKII